jgi:hypothetical protein
MEGVAQWMGLDQRCGTWMNEPQQVWKSYGSGTMDDGWQGSETH